ncbi:M20 family metallopeptidase [Brevibacillus humidisoli]|uniref:M20 family metallopeptidase n=1 Tax=Brevibacillus humidisoli TaxID=2895522 RepID=UPI001E32D5D3|nr:M20 family metallopeptidase [Brevibacillus humidisoli]UFJ42603.1 M20 family metallopeptidase [Brevibacillus humidisoli]
MTDLLSFCKVNQQQMIDDLERLVVAESPSHDKRLVDQCGVVLQSLFRQHLGVEAEVIPQTTTGNHLRFVCGEGAEQILIIAHFDTVWDVGRLTYRVEGNRAYGPGIFDMKAGIIQALWAIKACRERGRPMDKKIVFLCTTDEEIGSETSRPYIEQEARNSAVVLVPEPPVANSGALKTARKGVGQFLLRIKGRASHAGNHHEQGISAVEELARQILYLHGLTNYAAGTTVNVGIARGGTRTNVVAEQAEAYIDVRVSSSAEGERMTELIRGLKPQAADVSLEVTGGMERPPMERTAATERLFQLAAGCAKELGFQVAEASVGGGSDGNFTAALGIPTLDGLGAMGDGPHAEHEHILIDQLPQRTALFTTLLTRL